MVAVIMCEQNSVTAAVIVCHAGNIKGSRRKIGINGKLVAHIDHNACLIRTYFGSYAAYLMCASVYSDFHLKFLP